jgi:ferredoxin-nitrite reductase
MNKIEEIKAEKDGLDVGDDLYRYAQLGWESIPEADYERLKWYGVFFRKRTPGFFMMRIRVTNGIANSNQARALGEIAKQFGRDTLDITTRQQVQLRWIRIENVPEILERLRAVGLSTLQTGMDNIRNVVGCPLSGLNQHELFDASPAAKKFTDIFVGNKEFTNLPRKFNVTITGCMQNCTHAELQDIALTPATRDIDGASVAGFNISVGGKHGSGGARLASPLDVFVVLEEAADVCRRIVEIFRDNGPREARTRCRLAFLVDDWGPERFRAELERRANRPLLRAGMDARVEERTDHLGIHQQKDQGLYYAGLLVPVGRMTGSELMDIARLAERYGSGEVRFTVDQNVILPNISAGQLYHLQGEPLLQKFSPNPSPIMRGTISCTGIDYCNLAVIDTKPRALALSEGLQQQFGDVGPLRIHWSGCPAGCGMHQAADIGFVGTKVKVGDKMVDAVNIYAGGRTGRGAKPGELILERVTCEELPQVVAGLIQNRQFEVPLEPMWQDGAVAPVYLGI